MVNLPKHSVLFSFISFIILISTGAFSKEITLSSESQTYILESKIVSLQEKLNVSEKRQTTLQNSLNSLNEENKNFENALKDLARQYERNRHSSSVGAICLLIGLMLEIVGAVFLASEILNKKVSLNRNLISRPSMRDLGLEDTAIRSITGFLTTFGVLIVFFGFSVQAIGTLIILGLPILWWIGIGFLMVITAGLTIWFVAGRSLEQKAGEKAKILALSIYYSFISPLIFKLWFGELCDYCRKPVLKKNYFISFRSQENPESHPYLHTPSNFSLGHKICLARLQAEEQKKMNTQKQKEDCKATQKLMDGDEFVRWSQTMETWHQKWRAHWAVARQNDLGDGDWYYKELRPIYKRIV